MRNATPACGAAEACAEQRSTGFRKPAVFRGPSTLAGKGLIAGPQKAAPLHNPDAKDALVLNAAQWRASSDGNVPVVVDPCAHTPKTASVRPAVNDSAAVLQRNPMHTCSLQPTCGVVAAENRHLELCGGLLLLCTWKMGCIVQSSMSCQVHLPPPAAAPAQRRCVPVHMRPGRSSRGPEWGHTGRCNGPGVSASVHAHFFCSSAMSPSKVNSSADHT